MSQKPKSMLDAFFTSGKKAKKAAVKEGKETIAPTEIVEEEVQSGLTLSAVTSNMVIGAKGVWIEDSDEKDAVDLDELAGALKLGVASEETYDGGADTDAYDAEAAEAKRKLWQAIKEGQKNKSQQTAPVPAPAAGAPTKWIPSALLKKSAMASSGDKNIDITNAEQFPSLNPNMEKNNTKATQQSLTKNDSKGQWSTLASGDSSDDETTPSTPAETKAVTAATVNKHSAWSAKNIASVNITSPFAPVAAPAPAPVAAPAPAPVAAAVVTSPVSAEASIKAGTGKLLSTDDDIKEVARRIASELKTSHDATEAATRVSEMNVGTDYARRGIAAEVFLSSGFDAENDNDRKAIGKGISALVKNGACSKDAIKKAVDNFVSSYDDLVCDYPKAADYLALMLSTIVIGCSDSENVIDSSILPAAVQKKLEVATTSAATVTAAEDDEDLFAGLKKKKKKNMKALADEVDGE